MAPLGLWLCHFVLLCASPRSLWALLQPIPAPAARPDTNIIPLWFSEASSSGQGACLTSRFFLFHRGGSSFGRIVLQDQHEVDGHLVYSTENPQMANTTHSLGSVSLQTHGSGRLQQSVRQAGPAADQRPQTKLGRLDQTNDPACGKVARLFKQRGDCLCTLLFIAAFIWGRIDFAKARRLSHPREQSLWGSQGCVAPHSTLDGEELCTEVLLSSFANMPPLDYHFYESCYKSLLLQWKHLLWLPALLLANVIVIIIPGRVRFSVIMSATMMRLDEQHQIIWVENILRGRMTFTQQLPAHVICMRSSVWKVEHKQEEDQQFYSLKALNMFLSSYYKRRDSTWAVSIISR